MPGRSIATTGTPAVGGVDELQLASGVGLATRTVLDVGPELVMSSIAVKTFLNAVRSREGIPINFSCWGINLLWRILRIRKRDGMRPRSAP